MGGANLGVEGRTEAPCTSVEPSGAAASLGGAGLLAGRGGAGDGGLGGAESDTIFCLAGGSGGGLGPPRCGLAGLLSGRGGGGLVTGGGAPTLSDPAGGEALPPADKEVSTSLLSFLGDASLRACLCLGAGGEVFSASSPASGSGGFRLLPGKPIIVTGRLEGTGGSAAGVLLSSPNSDCGLG